MEAHPWDGQEWSIDNFCSQITQRFVKLYGSGVASRTAARSIKARGLPPELVHELNKKMRDDATTRNLQNDVDVLCEIIHVIFKEFESSGMSVPWPQFSRPFKSSSRQASDEEDSCSEVYPDMDDQDRKRENDRRSVEEKRLKDGGKALHPNVIAQNRHSGSSSKDPASRSYFCYFCGERGHIERFCLKKREIVQTEFGPGNRISEGQENSVGQDHLKE